MNAKKFGLAASVVVAFVLYSVHGRNPDSRAAVVPPTLPPASAAPASNSGNSAASNQSTGSSPSSGSSPVYKDGQYTGSVADAYYGYIQVKAVVSGGKITDVQFLQYPNDRSTSIAINQQAMPYLKQEAIQAQSAQVDVVSGATDTSQAFVQSLSSALTQAE